MAPWRHLHLQKHEVMAFVLFSCLLFSLLCSVQVVSAKPKTKTKTKLTQAQVKNKLVRTTLADGDCTLGKALKGDKVALHYRAFRDNDDDDDDASAANEPFDETYKVGRPAGMTIGAPNTPGLLASDGFQRGVTGMCLGERRRIRIPPKLSSNGEQTTFEVEMVAINGAHVTAASLESDLSPHLYCNSCHTIVELFYAKWLETITDQEKKRNVESNQGGRGSPAVTYNDDVENMLQTFCDSDAITRAGWGEHLRPSCTKLMLGHKREFVAKYMSVEARPQIVPKIKNEVCGEKMVQACKPGRTIDETGVPKNECQQCRLVVGDVVYELQQRERLEHAGDARRRKLAKEVVESICTKLDFRHFKAYRLQEFCTDFIDDHGTALIDEGVRMLATGDAYDASAAQRMSSDLCGARAAGVCAKDEL